MNSALINNRDINAELRELSHRVNLVEFWSDLLASRASHNGWNGLIFGKSATFMHFDPHKKFQSDQITLSSSK